MSKEQPKRYRTPSNLTVEEYFWHHVNRDGRISVTRSDLGPCWEWTGNITPRGYARMYYKDVHMLAHVYSHALEFGERHEKLEDSQIDHLCRVRHCVNPLHMEIVNRRENILRGDSPPAQNARSGKCRWGHPMEGIRMNRQRQTRYCLICNNERSKDNYKVHSREQGTKPEDSPTAINAAKTHCIRGHLITGIKKGGKGRYCKECYRVASLARYHAGLSSRHKQ